MSLLMVIPVTRQAHADWNAAKNLSQWYGMACDLELQEGLAVMAEPVLNRGVHEAPLNSVTQTPQKELFEENENLQL
ncbi:MAG: hypothetical protein R2880_11360 [Deinococcales bacterium]